MAREEVSFARGTKSTMPEDKVPGRLLVATDTGEAYVDDTTTSRVQLKDTTKVSKSGDTMSGPLNMGSNKITNVATPTADTDAANLGSVKSETAKVKYTGGTAITVDDSDKTISHNNIGTAGSVGPTGDVNPGYGGTFQIPQITTTAQGHVAAITMRTVTLPSAQDIPDVETYTGVPPITVSGTQISHDSSVTAGNKGPTGNSTVSPGDTFTVPQIYYDAYGHVTSSSANRTLTLNPSILDTSDILTSLSDVTSNEKVLGAKLVADAINNLKSKVNKISRIYAIKTISTTVHAMDIFQTTLDVQFDITFQSNLVTDTPIAVVSWSSSNEDQNTESILQNAVFGTDSSSTSNFTYVKCRWIRTEEYTGGSVSGQVSLSIKLLTSSMLF